MQRPQRPTTATIPGGRQQPPSRPGAPRAGMAALGMVLALSTPSCAPGIPPVEAAETPVEAAGRPAQEAAPALVVVVVVDQLATHLLDRYADVFSGGLRRLLDRGYAFTQATHDHSLTETAPGHTTLTTGVHPSRSGIVGNVWSERVEGQWRQVYSVDDPETRLVGTERRGSSPSRLVVTGLADWMLESIPGAQVVSVSGKDRAAVGMAGKSRGHVYWFDGLLGRFVTSTWYRQAEPSWLQAFNTGPLLAHAGDSVWASTIPEELVPRTRRDTVAYEGDGVLTWLPHRYWEVRALAAGDTGAVADTGMAEPGPPPDTIGFFEWFEDTPMLDGVVLELAAFALDSLGLGRDQATDLLAISLSQTDRVGHSYGPYSREQLDNLLRLDRVLGAFLEKLDAAVGADRYVLGLSADHGVLPIPEYLAELGQPGRRLTIDDRTALQEALGAAARGEGSGESNISRRMARAAESLPFIEEAWAQADLVEATDSMALLFRRSLFPGRQGSLLSRFGVEYRYPESTIDWSFPRGTSHGSPYLYDRRVPMIFTGPGIPSGRDDGRAGAVDFAPTLAALVGLPTPGDLDGRPLLGKDGRVRP